MRLQKLYITSHLLLNFEYDDFYKKSFVCVFVFVIYL